MTFRTVARRNYQISLLKNYTGFLKTVLGNDLYEVFLFNESSGTVLTGINGNTGEYSGVTVGNSMFAGNRAPTLSGTGYISVHSANFVNNFPTDVGAIGIWNKVSSGADWLDGAIRRPINFIVDANNSMGFFKNTTNNQVGCFYKAGGVSRGNNTTILNGTLDWFLLGMNYADTNAGDLMQFYVNGAPNGTQLTGLGEFAGVFGTNNTIVGANDKSNNSVWKGNLAVLFVATRNLTNAEWASLYTYPNP